MDGGDVLTIIGAMAALLTVYGGLLIMLMNARFDGVNQRIDGVQNSLSQRIDGVQDSLNQRIDDLRSDLGLIKVARPGSGGSK